MSTETRYVVVYTVEHDEHGYITRAEGPMAEQAAMARRNELWDQEGGATVQIVEHVAPAGHVCTPPELDPSAPGPARDRVWKCPDDGRSFAYVRRMIGGESVGQWSEMSAAVAARFQ